MLYSIYDIDIPQLSCTPFQNIKISKRHDRKHWQLNYKLKKLFILSHSWQLLILHLIHHQNKYRVHLSKCQHLKHQNFQFLQDGLLKYLQSPSETVHLPN